MSLQGPSLAHRRPMLFAALVTVGFVVSLVLLALVASTTRELALQEVIGAVGRGLLALGAASYLWRLGWTGRLRWPSSRSS